MSTIYTFPVPPSILRRTSDTKLAASITKTASKQTYYTIRLLADRDRFADAYRAYAYFRWVDDILDTDAGTGPERSAFIDRQKSILENGYRGEYLHTTGIHEDMLLQLIHNDTQKHSGLQTYLRNMMMVMAFDVRRRGRVITQNELNEYTHWLASAITEAMHYFIGHGCPSPQNEARHLAVTAAHITHMLRDTYDDIQAGYFNIPREVLDANHIMPHDVQSTAYRAWVQSRVKLARSYFKAGREYLNQVENLRCRLAGFAYTARFEGILDSIEQEGYSLRSSYPERKGLTAIIKASGSILSSLTSHHGSRLVSQPIPVHQRPTR